MTATWPVKQLGDIFEIARGGSPRPIEKYLTQNSEGLNWVKISDATASGKYIKTTKEKIIPSGLSKTRQVICGDFLLTNSMSFGRPYIMATDGCIHDGWLLLRPRDESIVYREYFYHLLGSDFMYRRLAGRAAGSTVKNLNTDIVSNADIRLPPLDEQRRIAAILDKADALRQKRKKAIELLNSLVRSVFSEMFGGRKKNEGIRRANLRSLCEIRSGSTPSRADPDNFGGSIPWVKTTEVKGGIIRATEEKVTEKGAKDARLKIFPAGTSLIAMYGQGTTRGNVALLGIEATINQACAAVIPREEIHPMFLFQQLKLKYDELRKLGRGGNQPNMNLDIVGSIEIIVPEYANQELFVNHINSGSALIEQLEVAVSRHDQLFSSLQHRAFSGQL